MGPLIRWIANTIALFVVVTLVPHFHSRSIVSLAIAAAVLGLLNTIIRPILVIITLPLTILTLGLFLLVLNALMLEVTAYLVSGFSIDSFGWAVVGAVALAFVSLLTDQIGKKERD